MDPRRRVSLLTQMGRGSEAVALADELLQSLTDRDEAAGVLLSKLAAFVYASRLRECPPVVDAIQRNLDRSDARATDLAEFHALSALLAFRSGSLEEAVTHLAQGARTLEPMAHDPEALRSWQILAIGYSFLGLHRLALAAQERASAIGAPREPHGSGIATLPEIQVRYAVHLDQRGETQRAKGLLAEVIARYKPDEVLPIERRYLGYAIARHAALGGRASVDARPLLHVETETDPNVAELVRLGEAALAIAEHRSEAALDQLQDAYTAYTRLGRAEVPRLRALAYVALGDYARAYAADREATSVQTQDANRVYELFAEAVLTRVDYAELQRDASRFARQAMTDPLTGLPNRRHLQRRLAEMAATGLRGTLAVCDLNRFKDINTRYGHLVGDQVLEQVAAILDKSVRAGDFLARYGGDEFVLVFPDTDLAEAERMRERLAAEVARHPWSTLVHGTLITVTIGLAEFGTHAGPEEAFEHADRSMLRAKRQGAGRARVE